MLRSWDFVIELNQQSELAIHMQIVQKIVEEIQLGRLKAGQAMPGTRDLASALKLNRKTIVHAYEELVAQGWLVTQPRRGTFVNERIPLIFKNQIKPQASKNSTLPIQPEKNDFRPFLELNDGVPDTRLIPFEILSRAFRRALTYTSRANRLGYDDPRGTLALRSSISKMLNMERALHVDVKNICIVRGSQMGIFLAARILSQLGDNVVFENLSYHPAREAFISCGANVLTVGLDDEGLDTDALESLCKKSKIKAIYVTPHHQFPTSVMMTAERRVKLLMLAEKYDFVILEDDYDHEFHFAHRPVFPLASTNSASVIYVGSLSKVLAPGLRIGYLVSSQEFIDRCAEEIKLIDRQGNSVTELAVAELLDSGEVKRHIRKSYKIYNDRRLYFADLIKKELNEFVDFNIPDGGLAFWLKLKRHIYPDKLEKMLLQLGVQFSKANIFPNEKCFAIRIGYGSFDKAQLQRIVSKLKIVLSSI